MRMKNIKIYVLFCSNMSYICSSIVLLYNQVLVSLRYFKELQYASSSTGIAVIV